VIEPPFDTQAIQRVQGELPRDLQPVTYGLYFGGLDYLKGCDRLAAVLPDLLNRHETMRFVFAGRPRHVGDGRQFDAYLRSTLAPFGDRLLVLPELAREELYPLIAQARFVVLPSRVDNLPNACLEAMALRRVVVATRDASFEQLVEEGRTGWLVPQDDEAALTAAMERAWLLDESSRTEMGNCAAGSLQRLRPEQAAVRLIDYFKNMLANQTARGSGALAGTRTAAQQRSPASPEPPDSIASTHHLERQDLTNADRTSSAAGRTFD